MDGEQRMKTEEKVSWGIYWVGIAFILTCLSMSLGGCVKSVEFRTAKNHLRQQTVTDTIERFEAKLAHKQEKLLTVQERGERLQDILQSQKDTNALRGARK